MNILSPGDARIPRATDGCVYADEYSDTGDAMRLTMLGVKTRRDRFVLDAYADKVVAEYTEHDGRSITTAPDAVMCRTEAEFETRKAELFGLAKNAPPANKTPR